MYQHIFFLLHKIVLDHIGIQVGIPLSGGKSLAAYSFFTKTEIVWMAYQVRNVGPGWVRGEDERFYQELQKPREPST